MRKKLLKSLSAATQELPKPQSACISRTLSSPHPRLNYCPPPQGRFKQASPACLKPRHLESFIKIVCFDLLQFSCISPLHLSVCDFHVRSHFPTKFWKKVIDLVWVLPTFVLAVFFFHIIPHLDKSAASPQHPCSLLFNSEVPWGGPKKIYVGSLQEVQFN